MLVFVLITLLIASLKNDKLKDLQKEENSLFKKCTFVTLGSLSLFLPVLKSLGLSQYHKGENRHFDSSSVVRCCVLLCCVPFP